MKNINYLCVGIKKALVSKREAAKVFARQCHAQGMYSSGGIWQCKGPLKYLDEVLNKKELLRR